MAGKSITQRIVEGVAVVLAAVALVPLVVALGGRFWPKAAPQANTPQQAAPAAQPVSAEPIRQQVDSVEKLPATYPGITEVVLETNSTPVHSELPAATAAALQGIGVRHLNAFSKGEVRLSPDARLAIVDETTPANTHRLAVWDLEIGKLLRFLASQDEPTKPYQGKENADFGAHVDFEEFRAFDFSPSGKRFAARQGSWASKTDLAVFAWDAASGRLLSRYAEHAEAYDIFLFPHDDYVVMNVACGQRDIAVRLQPETVTVVRSADVALVRVDVNRGEGELLTPVGGRRDTFWQRRRPRWPGCFQRRTGAAHGRCCVARTSGRRAGHHARS